MNLQQWLEIQGAKYPHVVVRKLKNGDFHSGKINTVLSRDKLVTEYEELQLYDMVDGELKRIDKPVIKCRHCDNWGWQANSFNLYALGWKDRVCPDCQAKQRNSLDDATAEEWSEASKRATKPRVQHYNTCDNCELNHNPKCPHLKDIVRAIIPLDEVVLEMRIKVCSDHKPRTNSEEK